MRSARPDTTVASWSRWRGERAPAAIIDLEDRVGALDGAVEVVREPGGRCESARRSLRVAIADDEVLLREGLDHLQAGAVMAAHKRARLRLNSPQSLHSRRFRLSHEPIQG